MLTVLMATHNGERTLPEVLGAYRRFQTPPGGWRLVVVDNSSSDRTPEILASFAGDLPLTRAFEPVQGQNRARNAGLERVTGDLVIFADDDAIPREDWLVRMREAADRHPDYAIFGGVVLPRWETPPEEWLLRWVPLDPCFAITRAAWEEGPIKSDFVFSPNMAIRADLFRSGHRFDEAIGPRRGSYPMGSETELTRRLARAGARAWHVREAVVEHIIRAPQMTREWLLARAVRYGRGQYRLAWTDREPPGFTLLGVPGRLLARIGVQGLRLGLARWWRRDAEETFKRRWTLHCLAGNALEARRLARDRQDGAVPRVRIGEA